MIRNGAVACHETNASQAIATITFVVVQAVAAILLQEHAAIFPIPAVGAATLPLGIPVELALPVARARVGAALHRAVLPVPARDAEAGAVLALAVLVAPQVALLQIAKLPGPAVTAVARVVHAVAVHAAVEVAQLCNDIESKREKLFPTLFSSLLQSTTKLQSPIMLLSACVRG